MTPRAYTTSEPGKVSGVIAISERGTVRLIPAFRWLPAREITRQDAAAILREARKRTTILKREARPWETA